MKAGREVTRPFDWSPSGRECLLIYNQGGKSPWEATKAQETWEMRPLTLTVLAIFKFWQVTEKCTIMYLAVTKLGFPLKRGWFWLVWVQPWRPKDSPFLPLGTVRRGVLGHGKVVHTCAQERQSRRKNPTNRYKAPSKKIWTFTELKCCETWTQNKQSH